VQYSDIQSTTSASTGLSAARQSVELASNGSTILVRGTDLAAFSLVTTLSGYYFTFPADSGATNIATPPPNGISTALGFTGSAAPAGAAGKGLIAFFPGDSSQALIAQTSTSALTLTHVSNLPNSISLSGSFAITGGGATKITSVAVTPNGSFGIIGTDSGIYLANLGNNSVAQSGITTGMIKSVGVSADGNFVLAQSGNTIPNPDTLTVYPFSNNTIGTTASGTFTLPASSTGDYMVVR
jgi:hypothetical protein